MRTKSSYQLPYLTLFFKVYSRKENNSLPAFEPDCDVNINEVVSSEDKMKKKSLNLNPYKSLEVNNLNSRMLKELSVSLLVPLSILCTKSFK